jgi:tetratricopeptide (TPR) repeat protein
MSQIRKEQHNLEDARRYIDKAKEIDKFNPDVKQADALLLADEGRLPEAISAMKEVIDLVTKPNTDPRLRAGLLEELGSLYRRNEQYDQAVETFKQMISIDKDSSAGGAALIIGTHREAKDYTKAQQEADAAIATFPTDPGIISERAQLFSDESKPDAAVAELRKLANGKNDLGVDLEIAEVYQRGRNYPEAEKALDAAEKLAKDDKDRASVFFSRGALYERQKKYDLAEKEFRRVLDNDSKNASALNYLGYMLADRNVRLTEAQDYIKRAVDLEPGNYAFLDSLGWVYFRLNKLDDAERQLTRSLQLSSEKDPTIHDHMGDVYFQQGKLKQAISQWQSSLKAFNSSTPGDVEPDEVVKVQKKLDNARVKLAKEESPAKRY